jgi:hypothetical protein
VVHDPHGFQSLKAIIANHVLIMFNEVLDFLRGGVKLRLNVDSVHGRELALAVFAGFRHR